MEKPHYRTNEAERKLLARIRQDFTEAHTLKSRAYEVFYHPIYGARSVDMLHRDSKRLFDGLIEDPTTGKTWKSRHVRNKIHKKVVASVAQTVSAGLGLDFGAYNSKEKLDRVMSRVTEDLYEWTLEREEFDFLEIMAEFTRTTQGTVHIMDEIAWDEREVREIVDIEFGTDKISTEKKKRVEFKGCRSTLVPNDEIFIANPFISNIQDQSFIIRRQITSKRSIDKAFGGYKRYKHVISGQTNFFGLGSIQNDKELDDIDDRVEVLYYWSKDDDTFAIIINGVLITPADFPFPYPHKQYPIAKSIYLPFSDERMYWGNPLPNVLADEQHLSTQLWRGIVDAQNLKRKPPIATNDPEMVSEDIVIPGAIVQAENPESSIRAIQGVSNGVDQADFNVLALNDKAVDDNSVDAISSASQAQGDQTATEVKAIVGSAERLRGVSEQFFGHLLMQHARLRIPNILWFITHDDDFAEIVRNDVQIDGGRGDRYIRFAYKTDMPDSLEVLEEEVKAAKKGENIQVLYVNREKVNDYRYHVSVSVIAKPRRTSAAKVAKAIQKYQLYATNQLVDQEWNSRKLVEALGDEPDEAIKQNMPTPDQMGMPKVDTALSQAVANEAPV